MIDPDLPSLPTFCPFCGRTNNCYQNANAPATPSPGAVGICWGCTKVFVFDSPTAVRRPTPDEQVEIDNDPAVAFTRGVMRESYYPDEAVALTRQVLEGQEDGT